MSRADDLYLLSITVLPKIRRLSRRFTTKFKHMFLYESYPTIWVQKFKVEQFQH